ncbi:UNVERIFIED_ORG: hypothetical protein J2W64_001284 [Rahnella aquatilis]|nr:hypothetical protein [Rahnella aquatilis]
MQATIDGVPYAPACNSGSGYQLTSKVVSNEMISSERYSRREASPRGGGLAENG